MLVREGRRWLRDEARHASNPREARVSSAVAVGLALVLLLLAGGLIALVAGAATYAPLREGVAPSVRLLLEPETSGLRVRLLGVGDGPSTAVRIDGGWFSVSARVVRWRGPLRWIGFRDAVRPHALLWARARSDLADAKAIERRALSGEAWFERWLTGPASQLGAWEIADVRTPWRPARPGPYDLFFSESGGAVTVGETQK